MAEFPALPLWTDAYLGDTTHLTTIEHGAYLLLLMTAWRSPTTSLPDDDKLLSRYARCTPGQWKRLRPVIASFFTVQNGLWRQSRLTDEAAAVRQIREKRAKAGVASALKRKGRHATPVEQSRDFVPTNDEQTGNKSEAPTPTPTPIPEDKSSGGGTAKRGARLPDDFVMPEDWKVYALEKGHSRAVVDLEAEKFTLHWRAETGVKAVKRDWNAAWRKWMLGVPLQRAKGHQQNLGGGSGFTPISGPC